LETHNTIIDQQHQTTQHCNRCYLC